MKGLKNSLRTRLPLAALALVLLASLASAAAQPAAAASSSLTIVSVEAGQSATIKAAGLPANTAVTVRMAPMGSKAAGGTIVGKAVSASNGTLKGTYAIPKELKLEARIAMRVEATAKPSQFAYNWFNNTVSSVSTSASNAGIPSGAASAGKITIVDVAEDDYVTISVTGAPAQARLAVWFDWKNKNGVLQARQAGTVKVSSSGALNDTIDIPTAAKDRGELRIRLQGLNGANYLAYRWFLNADNDDYSGSSSAATSENGIAYIVVQSVVKNDTVTLDAINFAKGEYVVLMDKVGSGAKNGIKVDTITIKQGKTFTGTFDIPSKLVGEDDIAIRIQSVDDSTYYAFTWFDNVTSN